MKLRNPLLIRVIASIAAVVLAVLLWTLRVRIISVDGRRHPTNPDEEANLYLFWHESLLSPITKRGPKVHALISQHADGELIAQVCLRLGIGVVRGSSTRGGAQALLEMIRGSNAGGHLVITPDGPRGPRRAMKSGLVLVASQTGLPVVPVGVGFTSAWRARSWDRFAVPKPFSTLLGIAGAPIHVPPGVTREEVPVWLERINAEMQRLTAEAEAWAERWRQGDMTAPALHAAEPPIEKSAA